METIKKIILFILTMITLTTLGQNNKQQNICLWPGKVPGETETKHEPRVLPDEHDKIIRLSDVTNPALVVFDACRNCNGSAVIVCPGGGYGILAIDLEGYEIATWLNSIGVTAFVLQYRVPDKRDGALQDLQRAMRMVRENAGKWNLDPDKIGVMGFSAGGSLSARLCALPDSNLYPTVDQADKLRFRPDFCLLVYPAYLDKGPGKSVSPENAPCKDTPPTFIFATADDPHSNSALVMASAMRDAQRPVELHLLPDGGHGYGLRQGKRAGETWPGLAHSWLDTILKGAIKPPLNHEE
jgi:acetyl esterase/lipase